jgi:hypothetical protein
MGPVRWAAAALAALTLGGCAGTTTRGGDPVDAEARSTLSAMASEFSGGQSEDFFARFDRRDFPNFEAFRERERDYLLRNRQVNLDIIVDTILHEDREVAVQAHWNRSFVNENGDHKLEDGRCEFVFRRRPSGGLALLSIHGESPF